MKSKIHKKLNQKGLSHNLLLILVAVVAVVGASGFFVWQRQNNDGINASAAGLKYIAPNAQNSYAQQYISMYACKNPAKYGSGNYVISFEGKTKDKSTYQYKIRKNGKVWQTVYFYQGIVGERKRPTGALQAYKTDYISISYTLFRVGGEFNYTSIPVTSIANC